MFGEIMNNKFKLFEKVFSLSCSNDWNKVKREWIFAEHYESDEILSCACGHNPITNVYEIHNVKTGKFLQLGSECISKFLPEIEEGLRKNLLLVMKQPNKSLHLNLINYFVRIGVIDQTESMYYIVNSKRRKLPVVALEHRKTINKKVLPYCFQINEQL